MLYQVIFNQSYSFFLKCLWSQNLFLSSFKIYLVKYAIPKFETSGIKSNDFTSLQNWSILPSKMVSESRGQNTTWHQPLTSLSCQNRSHNGGYRKEKRKPPGRYCVPCAPNQESCQNKIFTPGIRMYQFPSDPAVRTKWVQFVRRHRHDFKDPTSKYSSLCSAHFEESSYERSPSILSSLEGQGKMKSCLKNDAIPTRDSVRSNHRIPFSLMHWWPLCSNETRVNQLNSRSSIVHIST